MRVFWKTLALIAASALAACKKDERGNPGDEPLERSIGGDVFARTLTTGEDFRGGQVDGLSIDAQGHLQMSEGAALYETPFIWVPNSADRSLTKISATTLEVMGTFDLRDPSLDADPAVPDEWCNNPSRTTVDLATNVWVGCRGYDSYIDREDMAGREIPYDVDNKIFKLSSIDGSVMLALEVGWAPRAMAIDVNNHVWVGCSVDDTFWEIDGDTGHCYRGERADCDAPPVVVDDFPYGAAIDQRGHLWAVSTHTPSDQAGRVTQIRIADGQVLGAYGPWGRRNHLYGIAIDQLGDVWVGGYQMNDIIKLKGMSGTYIGDGQTYASGDVIGFYDVGGRATRGVAVDLDGNVWAVSSGTNTATKLNGLNGAIITTVNVGQSPIGVGVDAYGNAWVVNRGSNDVTRINGLNVSVRQRIDVGLTPYTYSDMLGTALRTITHRADGMAYFRTLIDSGVPTPTWDTISWNAFTPPNTAVRVRSRCAADQAALAGVEWGPTLDAPGSADCGPGHGRWMEVEVRMQAIGTTNSPILYDLTVRWR